MDTFLDNARRILDVAQSAENNGSEDFALVIKPDGGLHFIMDSPFSIEAAAVYAGSESAYRVTRSRGGVRVEGKSAGLHCVLEQRLPGQRNPRKELFRDQALYLTGSALAAIDRA